MLFECLEVGGRVAPEAPLRVARLVPAGQLTAEWDPAGEITRVKVDRAEGADASGHGGQEADGAAHDCTGRGVRATGGVAWVRAGDSEAVLPVIAGPGQIRHVLTVEEARRVAASHLEEMIDGGTEGARGRLPRSHLCQEVGVSGADPVARVTRVVGQQVSHK